MGRCLSPKCVQAIIWCCEKKWYEVIFNNVHLKKPLSSQIFPVHEDAVVFGFSFGSILSCLTAQKYSCRCIILASMTPHIASRIEKSKKRWSILAGSRFIGDIVDNLTPEHCAKKQTILYGDQEVSWMIFWYPIRITSSTKNTLRSWCGYCIR